MGTELQVSSIVSAISEVAAAQGRVVAESGGWIRRRHLTRRSFGDVLSTMPRRKLDRTFA